MISENPHDISTIEKESFNYAELLLILALICALVGFGLYFEPLLASSVSDHWISENETLFEFLHTTIFWFSFGLISLLSSTLLPRIQHSINRAFRWTGIITLIGITIWTLDQITPVAQENLWYSTAFGASILGLITYLWRGRESAFSPYRIVKNRIRFGRCPKCGYSHILNRKFCGRCGYRISRLCDCGASVYNFEKFCPTCGKKQNKFFQKTIR